MDIIQDDNFYRITFTFFLFCYQMHWYTLVNVLFFRLNLVFNPEAQMYSNLTLSKSTILLFTVLSISYLLNTISSVVIQVMQILDLLILTRWIIGSKILIYFVLNLIISIYITIIFIYKLCKMDKIKRSLPIPVEDKQQDSLLPAIIKYTNLATISTITTIITLLTFGNSWLVLLDIFTNFLCITLSLKHSEKAYQKLCCCIDRQCSKLVNKRRSILIPGTSTECVKPSTNIDVCK